MGGLGPTGDRAFLLLGACFLYDFLNWGALANMHEWIPSFDVFSENTLLFSQEY